MIDRVVFSRHRFFALVALIGWLFAAGHVALADGGFADGEAHHACMGEVEFDGHDADGPAETGGHHHHDLSAVDGGRSSKTGGLQTPPPIWVPLFDALADRLGDLQCSERDSQMPSTREHAPPDARVSGWLLECQTALPVRGPSLAV